MMRSRDQSGECEALYTRSRGLRIKDEQIAFAPVGVLKQSYRKCIFGGERNIKLCLVCFTKRT